MSTKAEWTIDILKNLLRLPFVSDVEVTKPPPDVDADLGILIKVRDKKSSDGLVVAEMISDLQWKIFEETGELRAIYWNWEKV